MPKTFKCCQSREFYPNLFIKSARCLFLNHYSLTVGNWLKWATKNGSKDYFDFSVEEGNGFVVALQLLVDDLAHLQVLVFEEKSASHRGTYRLANFYIR